MKTPPSEPNSEPSAPGQSSSAPAMGEFTQFVTILVTRIAKDKPVCVRCTGRSFVEQVEPNLVSSLAYQKR